MNLLPVNFLPENPLGISLPPNFFYPEVDWDKSGSTVGDLLTSADPVQAALYAWVIYGVLIVANWSYYSDRYYYFYTMDKHGTAHLAWRTWYGVATWIRDITKCASWGITGLFWAFSLMPYGTTFSYFS